MSALAFSGAIIMIVSAFAFTINVMLTDGKTDGPVVFTLISLFMFSIGSSLLTFALYTGM